MLWDAASTYCLSRDSLAVDSRVCASRAVCTLPCRCTSSPSCPAKDAFAENGIKGLWWRPQSRLLALAIPLMLFLLLLGFLGCWRTAA